MLKLKKRADSGGILEFVLKYNGKFKPIKTGESIDIRDFDVANKDVLATEKHLLAKYPGYFSQEKTVGPDPEVEEAVKQELKEQAEKIEKLVAENTDLREKVNGSTQQIEDVSAQLQTETERAESLKVETDNALARLKDLEDENEKLRLQVAEGDGNEVKELRAENKKLKDELVDLRKKKK